MQKAKTSKKRTSKKGVSKPKLQRQNALRAIPVERKSVDLTLSADFLAPTPGSWVIPFGTNQQGSTAQNRIGRKQNITDIHLVGQWSPGVETFSTYARVAVVWFASGNTAPTATDIWQGFSAGGTAIPNVAMSGRNLNQSDKYKILAVKDFQASSSSGQNSLDTSSMSKTITWYLKGLNLKQKYSGPMASDLVSGSLYVVAVMNPTPTAASPFNGVVRVRFTDC